MLFRIAAFGMMMLLLAAGGRSLAAQGLKSVKEVRYVSLGDTTRVVVELSGEVEFRTERIEGPDRVFFDLQGASPRRHGLTLAVGDQTLKRIRVAENQPGVTRLVFDIESRDVDFKVSRLVNPDRLIVEFTRTAPDRMVLTPAKELLADAQPAAKISTPSVTLPVMPDVEPETTVEYPPFVPPQRAPVGPRRAVVITAEPQLGPLPRSLPAVENGLLAHNRFPEQAPRPEYPAFVPPPRVASTPRRAVVITAEPQLGSLPRSLPAVEGGLQAHGRFPEQAPRPEYPAFVPPPRVAPASRRPVIITSEPRLETQGRQVPQGPRVVASYPPAPPLIATRAPEKIVAKVTPPAEKPAGGSVMVAKKPDEPYSYTPKDTRKGPYPTEQAAPGVAKPDGSMIRALGLKIGRIAIDPGHGGQDNGAVGPTGLMEKEVALDVSQRLAGMLQKRLGADVVLLRNDDTAISPEQRTAMANESKADLFVSIHANSSVFSSAVGIETFYLNLAGSAGATEVAARENASSQRNLHEMQGLLETIALNTKVNESREFAARVQKSLVDQLKGLDRGVKRAPFIVLIGAQMPAILVEVGFISNPKEEQRMRQAAERQKIAESLFKGIASYAASLGQYEVAQRTE